jgi:hypothetical protein
MPFSAVRKILFTLLLFHSVAALCQNMQKSKWEFHFNVQSGKLIKIYDPFPENQFTGIIKGTVYRQTDGSSNWHHWQGYPSVGITAAMLYFHPDKILGTGIGLIPEMKYDFQFFNRKWYLHAGLGLAWFNRPYNPISNPENRVIGAPLVNMTCIGMETTGLIHHRCNWSAGISYTHCSNAHVAVPNIGANVVSIHVGLAFRSRQLVETEKKRDFEVNRINKIFPLIQLMAGVHEFPGTISPRDGLRYKKGGLCFGIEKIHTPFGRMNGHRSSTARILRGKYGFGINAYYDQALYQFMVTQDLFPAEKNSRTKAMNLAFYGTYEWLFGRFAFFVQGGIDVYAPGKEALNKIWNLSKSTLLDRHTSNKIGYKFYFNSPVLENPKARQRSARIFAALAVKANGGTADYLEFSIGASLVKIPVVNRSE